MKRSGMVAVLVGVCGAGMPAFAAPAYQVIYNFRGGPDGANPLGQVGISAENGLYGTAVNGGHNYVGSIFHLIPPGTPGGAWTEETLYSFAGPDGQNPYGGVLFDKTTGGLVGTTEGGGANNVGTIFSLVPPAGGVVPWIRTDLHDFTAGTDGSNPRAGLAHCGGSICGIGTVGGANGLGTVFSIAPHTAPPYNFHVIWTFAGDDSGSSTPYSALVEADAAGTTLFGTATGFASGQGAVYALQPTPLHPQLPYQFSILHTFPFSNDGYHPAAPVKLDASGTLYGTTEDGGAFDGGTVFRMLPPTRGGKTWTESVIYNFHATCHPTSGLVLDNKGALMGTTYGCGANGLGMVFRLVAKPGDVWTLTSLHDFSGGTDGANPTGGLARLDNVFYGTTTGGEDDTAGTVYSISP